MMEKSMQHNKNTVTEKQQNGRPQFSTRLMTITAMFMAMNVVLSSFSIPVPGGHLYLNDIIICTAAILLAPFPAFVVGGVGAFLGDLFFYPAPMFVSLVTHGLQAVVISLCTRGLFKNRKSDIMGAVIGVLAGAVIMVAGYTFGRAYIYSTPAYSLIKLPYEILQAAIGAVVSIILCYGCGLKKLGKKYSRELL